MNEVELYPWSIGSMVAIPVAISQLILWDNSTTFWLSTNGMYIIYGIIIADGIIGILDAYLLNQQLDCLVLTIKLCKNGDHN